MAAQICIKMARGTFFQRVDIAHRFLMVFFQEVSVRGCTETLFFD